MYDQTYIIEGIGRAKRTEEKKPIPGLELITADILAFEHKVEFEAAVDKPNECKNIAVAVPLINIKIPVDQRDDKIHQYHLK